jgi:hypothetical protein
MNAAGLACAPWMKRTIVETTASQEMLENMTLSMARVDTVSSEETCDGVLWGQISGVSAVSPKRHDAASSFPRFDQF